MTTLYRENDAWALKWISDSRLDGHTEHIMGDWKRKEATRGGSPWATFRTRAEARAYRDENFGYFRDRPDLRAEPHGWKMPQVVKVVLSIQEHA